MLIEREIVTQWSPPSTRQNMALEAIMLAPNFAEREIRWNGLRDALKNDL